MFHGKGKKKAKASPSNQPIMMASLLNDSNIILNKTEPQGVTPISRDSDSGNDSGSRKESGGSSIERATTVREDGKIELTENDAYEHLGFSFPTWRKRWILTVVFFVQVSMNLNASLYANAVDGISSQFNVSKQAARVGQAVFLIAYGLGSELWAPWSEQIGRKPILQASLFLVNIWQVLCAMAPNYGSVIVGRFLGGLSSAGGSVTLGMVADMFEPEEQGFPLAYIVLSSVGGSAIGPIIGGFIQENLHWRWNFWIQLIVGGTAQIAHLLCVPETRTTIILDKVAKKRRKSGEITIYGPTEIHGKKLQWGEVLKIWARPFKMFFTEPIVLWLSLLSGFSDALIFTFLSAFGPVFSQWGFNTIQCGLAFIAIIIGYIIGYISFLPFIHRHNNIRKRDPTKLTPESRLYWLLFVAPLEAIGLFGFAWTSFGPQHNIHWVIPLFFAALIAIANLAIYMATIDYMVASYGEYAASATGGNALARDLLAGAAAMYSTPLYTTNTKFKLQWPTTILAIFAIIFTAPIYLFYHKGPQIRAKSKFASTIAHDRDTKISGRKTKPTSGPTEEHTETV